MGLEWRTSKDPLGLKNTPLKINITPGATPNSPEPLILHTTDPSISPQLSNELLPSGDKNKSLMWEDFWNPYYVIRHG